MTDRETKLELISALVDGQLRGRSFEEACSLASEDDAAREAWIGYHVIGEALRSNGMAMPSIGRGFANEDFVSRLRGRLADSALEPLDRSSPNPEIAVVAAGVQAANDSVFLWKMVAGFATLAAVAVIGWTSLQGVAPSAPAAQLAQASLAIEPVQASSGAATGIVTASAQTSNGVMIRDPRLDELLAAHRQNGGASALQMPSGFLRNATFDGPNR